MPDIGNVDFSTRVDCLEGKSIAVDRTMFWTGPGAPSQEGHSSIGTTSPSKTWYLPEGSSNWNFETWTLIENPNDTEANITLTYMTEKAGTRDVTKKIPAHSRASYNMESDIGKADASIKVTSSDVPVIAERSMYRNNRREGSCSIGATTPASDYFLSEGSTAWGFTTYVLIQNPNDSDAQVTLTYMTPGGPVEQPVFTMGPNSRKTIRVNDVAGVSNTDLSTQVHSDKPIIAERSMYWGAGTPLGEAMHDSIGLDFPHMTFYLPDGQTGTGRQTWTLVQNPNPGAVTVRVTYLPAAGGTPVSFTDEIPPNTRRTYSMGDKIPSGRASTMVESLDGARPIMVERSMYWNNNGAGTNTIGAYRD
jgi:P pilus assembly chaperone PapD